MPKMTDEAQGENDLVKHIIDLSIAHLCNAIDLDGGLNYRLSLKRSIAGGQLEIESELSIAGTVIARAAITVARLHQPLEKVE